LGGCHAPPILAVNRVHAVSNTCLNMEEIISLYTVHTGEKEALPLLLPVILRAGPVVTVALPGENGAGPPTPSEGLSDYFWMLSNLTNWKIAD
jgi:hypothetical protein